MRKLHVAFDMDDVVIDFWNGVLGKVEAEYGVDLRGEHQWDDAKVKNFSGFGKGGFWGWMEDHAWLWGTFEPVQGALGGLRQLRQDGHRIEALTSKPTWAESAMYAWIEKYRPPFNTVNIVSKDEIKFDVTKASILIDDKESNLKEFVGSTQHIGVLFSDRFHPTAYNAFQWRKMRVIRPMYESLYRVNNWQEVVEFVRRVAEE